MNRDMTPGPPEGQEPIEQLFRDVFARADEIAQRITDAEVDAQLDQLLRKTGHATPPAPEPDPASVLNAACAQAREIVADAHRAATETALEAACAARAAEETARRKAERIIAEATEYSDTALTRAAAIITEARAQAEFIIRDAMEQASRIVADARPRPQQAASRRLALTDGQARDLDCHWATAALLTAFSTAAGFGSADGYDRLPMPAATDLRAQRDKASAEARPFVLKFCLDTSVLNCRPDASQDQDTPGLAGRIWRSMRSRWQPRPRNATTDLLVVGYWGSRVVELKIALHPDGDDHVADLRSAISRIFELEEQAEQPASQDGGPVSIRGKIEALY